MDGKHGVAIVVPSQGRFLMIRRAPGILAGGAWCFVGGGVEPGESQEAAVVREFFEEVGGRVRAQRKVWEHRLPDGTTRLHWWLAVWDGGLLRANPAEVAELRWCTPDEIEALPGLLAGNRQFLAAVGRQLLNDAAVPQSPQPDR